MGRVTIDLPFPPSVNHIWRMNKRSIHLAESYRQWKHHAGWNLNEQKPKKISGSYRLTICLVRPDGRRRDLGNFEKVVSDLLVDHGIVEDDKLAERITLEWVPDGPPCRAIIEPVEPTPVSAHKVRRAA